MYCPECGLEYQEAVSLCSECGVALEVDPPPAPAEPTSEWIDLETVLETGDVTLLLVARSLLEAEGVPCFARGEQLQEFLGWGRLPSGVNLVAGPVQLQVPRERSHEARQLLRAVEAATLEEPPED